MNNLNDVKLSDSLLELRKMSRRLCELTANNKTQELWQLLGEMNRHSQLAMYRLMDLGL